MTAPVTAGAKLVATLESHTERVRRYRRRVLTRREAEDVHRLRVALRRLRVASRLARRAIRLPPEVSDSGAAAIASSLGKLRDSGVALASLRELWLSAKGRDSEVAGRLVARVERRERNQLDRARQSLRRDRVRRLLLGLRRVIRRPGWLPLGRQPLDRARQILLAPAWQAVVEHQAWQLPPSGPGHDSREAERSRHQLRVRIKELRDSLELLVEGPTDHRAVIDQLEQLASALGDLRDLTKLRAQVEGSSPALAALVEGRLARASERWQALRAEWLEDPPGPAITGPPNSPGALVPEPSGS